MYHDDDDDDDNDDKLLLRDGWPTKGEMLSQVALIFSKLTIDSLEQVVKYVQS